MAREVGPLTEAERKADFFRRFNAAFGGLKTFGGGQDPFGDAERHPPRLDGNPFNIQPARPPIGPQGTGDRPPPREPRFQIAQRSDVANDAGASRAPSGTLSPETFITGLVRRGLPLHVAQGVAGNVQQESGFNAGAVGDSGNAFGLFQHNGARRDALFAFIDARSGERTNPEEQLDFFVHELNTTERKARDQMLATEDARSAAITTSEAFFRPSDPRMSNRVRAATQFAGLAASPADAPSNAGAAPPPSAGTGDISRDALAAAIAQVQAAANSRGAPPPAPRPEGSPLKSAIAEVASQDFSAAEAPPLAPTPPPAPQPRRPAPLATPQPPERPVAPQRAPQPPALNGVVQASIDRYEQTRNLAEVGHVAKGDFAGLLRGIAQRSRARNQPNG
jgi:hypothetical protein